MKTEVLYMAGMAFLPIFKFGYQIIYIAHSGLDWMSSASLGGDILVRWEENVFIFLVHSMRTASRET